MTAGALPADDHVHTEWSWDAPAGSMERSCERVEGGPWLVDALYEDYAPEGLEPDGPGLLPHDLWRRS